MTDQPKWTPGPWRATTHDHPEQDVYAGYRIAKMTGGEIQRDRANANLIAAAPDLYAALEWAAQNAEESEAGRDSEWYANLERCNAALAKARGQA